jgi:hypothetical protein
MSSPINVGPFATNVLDLIGVPLCTWDGQPVSVEQQGIAFVVKRDGHEVCRTSDNLGASCTLNMLCIHRADGFDAAASPEDRLARR